MGCSRQLIYQIMSQVVLIIHVLVVFSLISRFKELQRHKRHAWKVQRDHCGNTHLLMYVNLMWKFKRIRLVSLGQYLKWDRHLYGFVTHMTATTRDTPERANHASQRIISNIQSLLCLKMMFKLAKITLAFGFLFTLRANVATTKWMYLRLSKIKKDCWILFIDLQGFEIQLIAQRRRVQQ